MPKMKYSQDQILSQLSENVLQLFPLFRKRTFHVDELSKRLDLSVCQMQMLVIVSERGAVTISQMSELLGIAKPNVTPQVAYLCRQGLLERKRSELDKRSVAVTLSDTGHKRLEEIRDLMADGLREEFQSMPYRDLRKLSDSFEAISRLMWSL